MCGISGELRTDGREPDERAVRAMTAAQADRGPDGMGHPTRGPLRWDTGARPSSTCCGSPELAIPVERHIYN